MLERGRERECIVCVCARVSLKAKESEQVTDVTTRRALGYLNTKPTIIQSKAKQRRTEKSGKIKQKRAFNRSMHQLCVRACASVSAARQQRILQP